jgi:hypothetical protein
VKFGAGFPPLPKGERGGVRGLKTPSRSDGVDHFFSAFFIFAGKGNPYANVFFFC